MGWKFDRGGEKSRKRRHFIQSPILGLTLRLFERERSYRATRPNRDKGALGDDSSDAALGLEILIEAHLRVDWAQPRI